MKIIILPALLLMFCFTAESQLTKGNWLVGGTSGFSSADVETISSSGTQKSTQMDISVLPNIGYLIIDRLGIGLRTGFTFNKSNYEELMSGGVPVAGGGRSRLTWFDIGPFVRYYFLPTDNRLNLVTEINYKYGRADTHPGKGKRDSYSFLFGPVLFFNSSVGIEFLTGYNNSNSTIFGLNSNSDDYSVKNSALQISIGLQIHLEKE